MLVNTSLGKQALISSIPRGRLPVCEAKKGPGGGWGWGAAVVASLTAPRTGGPWLPVAQQAMESQLSGSGLGSACWFSGRIGCCLFREHLPHLLAHLLLCYGAVHPDLPGPPFLCVGYSQSPMKSKTPPLPQSEKPGKIPCGRSLQAH